MTRSDARRLRQMIEKASASLSDADALKAPLLFAEWKKDTTYRREKETDVIRVRDPIDGLLYKLIPMEHTSQNDWPPRLVPAIWQLVPAPGQGDTPDNPIPWSWGLQIYKGKYFEQFNVLYVGIRDSGVGIHADLSALVNNYVEVV